MDEKLTKTSLKQRIFIGFIAFLMLGSFAAVYIGIAFGGDGSNSDKQNADVDQTKVSELLKEYTDKKAVADEAAKPLSDKYFPELKEYRSEVKAYNANSINEGDLTTTDLKKGNGTSIGDDTKYLAYYIGWCADESILDSSFDNYENPTTLKTPLDPSGGLIEGWTSGVKGMKIGGVRELAIPGKLAYGDTQEVCGAKNSPLKFVVMAIPYDEKLAGLLNDANTAYMRYVYYANYGIDINEMNTEGSEGSSDGGKTENNTDTSSNDSSSSSDSGDSSNNTSTDNTQQTTRKRKTSDVLPGL